MFVSWRKSATELPQFWEPKTHPVRLRSPNGKLALRVTAERTGRHYPDDEFVPAYYVVKNGKRLSPAIEPFSVPSALWSPSSEMLAVQSTDGGAVGTWLIKIYTVSNDKVSEHDAGVEVRQDLAKKFPAGLNPRGAQFFSEREQKDFARDVSWVNVIACGWLTAPDRLVVIGGVPPSGRYGSNLGKELAYTVDPLTGRILQSYTAKQARKKWPQCITDR